MLVGIQKKDGPGESRISMPSNMSDSHSSPEPYFQGKASRETGQFGDQPILIFCDHFVTGSKKMLKTTTAD
jgi:hypothetical protein